MAESAFEKQILEKLGSMEKSINQIFEYMEDSKLTDDERKLLSESFRHENEKKLVSNKNLKKKLGL